MTRDQKLSAISMKMARTGGGTGPGETGYYLPVMIGDVLHYIDKNCFWIKVGEGQKTRDLPALEKTIVSVYWNFIRGHHLPLDSQDTACIDYVYSLIS